MATRWGFEAVRALAIEHLGVIASPIDKIAFARSYNVDHWLVDAYVSVCERTDALSLSEAKRLPLEDVVKIGEARQALRGGLRPFTKSRSTVLRVLDVSEEATTPQRNSVHPDTMSDGTLVRRLHPPPDSCSPPLTGGHNFSSARVMDLITDGLTLLLGGNSQAHIDGKNQILATVQSCDMRSRTLRSILTLIIDKGLATWSDEPDNPGSRCASVCNEIGHAIGLELKDGSLSDERGYPLSGKSVLTHYITAICQERCDWTSISAAAQLNGVIRQAGFFGELYSYQLVSVKLVEAWWVQIRDVYDQTISMDISRLRHIHAFLVPVGSFIDVPAVGDLADAVFKHLNSRHRYDDWDAVQPEVEVSRIAV